jgi:hypothetical protein
MNPETILMFLAVFATQPETLRALARAITPQEWASRKLTPERLASLGLKGSPKLFKVLTQLGVPARRVELALSGAKNETAGALSYVLGEDKDLRVLHSQGDSKFYTSCQTTGHGLNEVHSEERFWGKSLFMWVIGNPHFEDGLGFRARAKLRLLYEDESCYEWAGLYVDRPYGQQNLLIEELDELHDWWVYWQQLHGLPGGLPILFPPVWQREDGAGADFEAMYGGRGPRRYCPSALGGYQDTCASGPWMSFGVERVGGFSLRALYEARTKVGGVYLEPLSNYSLNAQTMDIRLEKVEEFEPRRPLNEAQKGAVAWLIQEFGSFKGEGRFLPYGEYSVAVWLKPDAPDERKTLIVGRGVNGQYQASLCIQDEMGAPIDGGFVIEDGEVYWDVEELGISSAVTLPRLERRRRSDHYASGPHWAVVGAILEAGWSNPFCLPELQVEWVEGECPFDDDGYWIRTVTVVHGNFEDCPWAVAVDLPTVV